MFLFCLVCSRSESDSRGSLKTPCGLLCTRVGQSQSYVVACGALRLFVSSPSWLEVYDELGAFLSRRFVLKGKLTAFTWLVSCHCAAAMALKCRSAGLAIHAFAWS